MKRALLVLLLLIFCTTARADDQLAYLSKADAEKAAAFIRKQRKLFLYCGCCPNAVRFKLRAEKVDVRPAEGREGFYELIVTYTRSRSGTTVSQPVDLAYTWVKSKFEYHTVGEMLGLAHDPCTLIHK